MTNNKSCDIVRIGREALMKQGEMSAIGKMEVRAYERVSRGKTDELVERGTLKATVDGILGLPMETTDELGTKRTTDVRTYLVTEALKNTIAKGVELKDIALIQQLLGEQKATVDVNAKMSVAELFGDIRN